MYIRRQNQSLIYQCFDSPFVTALLGPRRVGKSTLVAHYAEEHNQKLWAVFNMDNRDERLRVEKGELLTMIQEAVRRQLGSGDKVWVRIDEAQKCPLLFDQVKVLYDKYKDQDAIKFILTGSGFLTLHQLSAESLAGRIELHHLHEFGLLETCVLQNNIKLPENSVFDLACDHHNNQQLEQYIEALAPLKPLLEKSLVEQLIWGGLPEVLNASEQSARRAYLSNYLQTYLEKDIRAVTSISDLNLYQQLMGIIAEQTGSVRQDTAITEALNCSRDTLKKYRGFLLATLVYREVYPFIGSSLRRLVKTPKGYLLNNGLLSYLTGLDDLNVLQRTALIGHRFENWFLKELQIWLDRETKRNEIYYWRTTGGVEVDFVVQRKPDVFPFEVTYSSRVQEKKLKNLKYFLQEEPKAKLGFYVYLGDFHYDAKERICFLPAWVVG